MPKKFQGAAFSRGDVFNTCFWWVPKEELPNGRFAKTVRNWRGRVVGYKEHVEKSDVEMIPGESIGTRKAVRAWTSWYGKFMRGWRLFKMGWNR